MDILLDTVDVEELFRTTATVLRSVPLFLRGRFRIALRTTEIIELVRGVRWKLFVGHGRLWQSDVHCGMADLAKTDVTLSTRVGCECIAHEQTELGFRSCVAGTNAAKIV